MGLEAHRALADELKAADLRLREWGDWSRQGRLNIGWPRESMTQRMVDWNRIGVRPERGPPAPISIPDDVAKVDSLVAKLPEQQKRVVTIHYTRDDPREVKLRMAKLKGDQYRRCLDYARWSIRLGLLL